MKTKPNRLPRVTVFCSPGALLGIPILIPLTWHMLYLFVTVRKSEIITVDASTPQLYKCVRTQPVPIPWSLSQFLEATKIPSRPTRICTVSKVSDPRWRDTYQDTVLVDSP